MNELELFKRAGEGDEAAKEKIVSDNQGLVYCIARRFLGRGYELEDIYQIGCIGLLKAIDRFDAGYEVKFSTYAVPLITGEIKRFLRDNGMIKVSRILKQNAYAISREREKYIGENGREPTMNEISAMTGLEDEEIVAALEANREVESLYQTVTGKDGSDMYLYDRIEAERSSTEMTEKILDKLLVEELMNNLDTFLRRIIYLRYFGEKTQLEVAKKLGISQVQVSRLEKKAMLDMKRMLECKSY